MSSMANDLITARELAVWTQSDVDEVTEDPFAIEVMDKVSQMAKFLGGHPLWDYDTAPFDVKMIVLRVSKRTYENPLQEKSTSIGPISATVVDGAALLTDLTPLERATLTKYNADGDPDAADTGLWVLHTTQGLPEAPEAILFVPDDSYSDWYLPMFGSGDPGDPALYEDA